MQVHPTHKYLLRNQKLDLKAAGERLPLMLLLLKLNNSDVASGSEGRRRLPLQLIMTSTQQTPGLLVDTYNRRRQTILNRIVVKVLMFTLLQLFLLVNCFLVLIHTIRFIDLVKQRNGSKRSSTF